MYSKDYRYEGEERRMEDYITGSEEEDGEDGSGMNLGSKITRTFTVENTPISTLFFKQKLVTSTPEKIEFWDLETFERLTSIESTSEEEEEELLLTSLISWNDELFIGGFSNGNICRYSNESMKLESKLHKSKSGVLELLKLSDHEFCSISGPKVIKIIIHSFPYHTIIRTLPEEEISGEQEKVISLRSKSVRNSFFLCCLKNIKLIDFKIPNRPAKILEYEDVSCMDSLIDMKKREVLVIGFSQLRAFILHNITTDEVLKQISTKQSISSIISLVYYDSNEKNHLIFLSCCQEKEEKEK